MGIDTSAWQKMIQPITKDMSGFQADQAARLNATFGIDADDLADHRPLELDTEATLWSRRIPHAEEQRGRAELEEGGRVLSGDSP